MSRENDLKRKIASMVGASVLASTLIVMPITSDGIYPTIGYTPGWASGGDGDGGDGGDGDGGGEGDSGGSGEGGGNSGSGGGSGGSGGSGGGESGGGSGGEGGGSGGSGSSGEGSSGGGGESGSSGNAGEHGSNRRGRGRKGKGAKSANFAIPARFGRITDFSVRGRQVEVRYSDGWKESIQGGRYSLKNPRGKTIVGRKARASDYNRMTRAIRK